MDNTLTYESLYVDMEEVIGAKKKGTSPTQVRRDGLTRRIHEWVQARISQYTVPYMGPGFSNDDDLEGSLQRISHGVKLHITMMILYCKAESQLRYKKNKLTFMALPQNQAAWSRLALRVSKIPEWEEMRKQYLREKAGELDIAGGWNFNTGPTAELIEAKRLAVGLLTSTGYRGKNGYTPLHDLLDSQEGVFPPNEASRTCWRGARHAEQSQARALRQIIHDALKPTKTALSAYARDINPDSGNWKSMTTWYNQLQAYKKKPQVANQIPPKWLRRLLGQVNNNMAEGKEAAVGPSRPIPFRRTVNGKVNHPDNPWLTTEELEANFNEYTTGSILGWTTEDMKAEEKQLLAELRDVNIRLLDFRARQREAGMGNEGPMAPGKATATATNNGVTIVTNSVTIYTATNPQPPSPRKNNGKRARIAEK